MGSGLFGGCFFSGCFFSGCFFSGCFFSGCFFSGCFFSGCFFSGCFFGVGLLAVFRGRRRFLFGWHRNIDRFGFQNLYFGIQASPHRRLGSRIVGNLELAAGQSTFVFGS
uniref:pentapeptide repeat-containing protein n=1 Tax=Novipirellula artificiosorum TaxID=2528016 RepID=UPI0036F39696